MWRTHLYARNTSQNIASTRQSWWCQGHRAGHGPGRIAVYCTEARHILIVKPSWSGHDFASPPSIIHENVEIVCGEMMNQQQQSAVAMASHMENIAMLNRQELAGMAAEHRTEHERLANSQAGVANRQRIAESVVVDLRDTAVAKRDHVAELAARAATCVPMFLRCKWEECLCGLLLL